MVGLPPGGSQHDRAFPRIIPLKQRSDEAPSRSGGHSRPYSSAGGVGPRGLYGREDGTDRFASSAGRSPVRGTRDLNDDLAAAVPRSGPGSSSKSYSAVDGISGGSGTGTSGSAQVSNRKSKTRSKKYVVTCPLPLPEFRGLQFPLTPEVYCGYRPTALELQALTSLVTAQSETGPLVDLIDPVRAYPWLEAPEARRAALASEDAALLVGVIPGVERLIYGNVDVARKVRANPIIGRNAAAAADVPRTWNMADPSLFRHPTKLHVKAVKVHSVLPHPSELNRKDTGYSLVQASGHQLTLGPGPVLEKHAKDDGTSAFRSRTVLEFVEHVSARLKRYSLFMRKPDGIPEMPDIVSYEYSRDYIVRVSVTRLFDQTGVLALEIETACRNNPYSLFLQIPQVDYLSTTLLLLFPKSGLGPVYFVPIGGPKMLFSKSGIAPNAAAPQAQLFLRYSSHAASASGTDAESVQVGNKFGEGEPDASDHQANGISESDTDGIVRSEADDFSE